MIILCGLLLGLPLLAIGGVMFFSPARASTFSVWFENSKASAAILTAVAWVWATYEIMIFGANILAEFAAGSGIPPVRWLLSALALAFDHFWVLTPILIYLTYVWMPANLPVRALAGILMLFPTPLFRVTRHYLPVAGLAPVHVFVVTAYIAAVIGMYGMFYPWRIEKAAAFILGRNLCARLLGALLALDGLALVIIGIAINPT